MKTSTMGIGVLAVLLAGIVTGALGAWTAGLASGAQVQVPKGNTWVKQVGAANWTSLSR